MVFSGSSVSSSNKTVRHNIIEIFLKVTLNAITLTLQNTDVKLEKGDNNFIFRKSEPNSAVDAKDPESRLSRTYVEGFSTKNVLSSPRTGWWGLGCLMPHSTLLHISTYIIATKIILSSPRTGSRPLLRGFYLVAQTDFKQLRLYGWHGGYLIKMRNVFPFWEKLGSFRLFSIGVVFVIFLVYCLVLVFCWYSFRSSPILLVHLDDLFLIVPSVFSIGYFYDISRVICHHHSSG